MRSLPAISMAWLGALLWCGAGCQSRVLEVVRDAPHAGPDAGARDAALPSDASGPVLETCNGKDDDADGQLDNLDTGEDGVCDCLRVVVLGEPSVAADAHVLDNWLEARNAMPLRRLGTRTLNATLLRDADLLVIEDLSGLGRTFGPSEAAALDAFVRAGGGLLVLAGFGTSIDNVNVLLAPYGLGFNPPDPLATPGLEQRVDNWAEHPVATGVTAAAVLDGQVTRGLGTALARAGSVEVARVLDLDAGHVLVWGDDFITDVAAWQGQSDLDIERLWLNALSWLTPRERCQVPVP